MSATVFSCSRFRVERRDIVDRNGRVRRREIVVHPGAAVILPLLGDGRIVMIRNFRHTIDRELLELPAGTCDRPGETPMDTAFRELQEETGYRAARMEPLCEFYTSPGIMDELIRAFVATDLSPAETHLDDTESIRVEIMKFDDALDCLARGEIVDAKTIITLMRWRDQYPSSYHDRREGPP